MVPARRRRRLELALIGVTAVWGTTFVVVKEGVTRVPPATFNAVRFLIAAAVVAVLCAPALRALGTPGLRRGTVLGSLLFVAYACQTFGLQRTEASTAGFITGMFVVFTPLLAALVLRRPPGRAALAGVVLATVGLALLSLRGSLVPGAGDVLVLVGALAFAGHIVGLGAWSAAHPPLALTAVQLGVAGLCHTLLAVAIEGPWFEGSWTATWTAYPGWDAYAIGAIAVTALLASAGGFWVQTAAQRVVPPTRTAIVLTMEPVFAGIAGWLWLDERLTPAGWLGGALILAGMLVAELAGSPRDEVGAGAREGPPARQPAESP